MEVLRTLDIFTVKEHINTVAVLDSSSVWVVLHNLGRVRDRTSAHLPSSMHAAQRSLHDCTVMPAHC